MPVKMGLVPRNRRPVPKEQRRDELLAAAGELFVLEGYDAVSMSRIATRAGVTPNTLYWYFRDKDALLVAVADRYLLALLDEHASLIDRSLAEQLAWLVERLRPVKHLIATIHSRLTISDAIAGWHAHFHNTFEEIFERQLQDRIPPDHRAVHVAAATFALEGAITHDLDQATTRQLCQTIATRLHDASSEAIHPA